MKNDKGISSFQLLQAYDLGEKRPPIVFYAFDVLHLNGKDLSKEVITVRKAVLEKLLKNPMWQIDCETFLRASSVFSCRIVRLCSSDSGAILRSTNVVSWGLHSITNTTYLKGVTYGAGLFIAVRSSAYNTGTILSSLDGAVWTSRTNLSGCDLSTKFALETGVL